MLSTSSASNVISEPSALTVNRLRKEQVKCSAFARKAICSPSGDHHWWREPKPSLAGRRHALHVRAVWRHSEEFKEIIIYIEGCAERR